MAKEEIAGLVVAVERYLRRDFAAEDAGWKRDLDTIARGLEGMPGIRTTRIDPIRGQRPETPIVEVHVDPDAAGLSAADLVNGLQEREPLICTVEGRTPKGIVAFLPQSLLPGDADEIVAAVRSLVRQPAGVR